MSESTGRWKDALLKTSLPLEQLVAERLWKAGFYVMGEYPYLRPNEHGISTEFSVDLHTWNLLPEVSPWASLSLLVECKYNYPGVRWVFSPYPDEADFDLQIVSVFDDLCTSRVQVEPLDQLAGTFTHCVRGIELHEKEANPQSITRALNQLRYAIPHVVSKELSSQYYTYNDEDLLIAFICPILVTSAPLFVLHSGLDLKAFENAATLSDIAQQTDSVIVYQEAGPQLSSYVDQTFASFLSNRPKFEKRLDALGVALRAGGCESYRSSSMWSLGRSLKSAPERVLIVHIDAFERVISDLWGLIERLGESRKTFAELAFDPTSTDVTYKPVLQ